MSHGYRMQTGRPGPLGATARDGGVNFAVFSAHAEVIQICLFDETGREIARLPLREREGDIWFGFIPDLGPDALYGLRAKGPYAPEAGHLFNPAKLLLDPYATSLAGDLIWHPSLMGHSADGTGPSAEDSAPYLPKARVRATVPKPGDTRPRRPWRDTVIYEAHVKGLTQQMPDLEHPGTFAALAAPPVVAHLTRLGITAIELLPVQAFITDAFLQERGLANYWGYQTLSFFAPHPAYLHSGALSEMQHAVEALHAAGIEVILDVVYNHSCEGGAEGPTLSFRGLDNASYYRLDTAGQPINDTGTGNTLNLAHPMVMRMVMDSLRYWVTQVGIDGFRFDLGATLGRTDTGFDRDAAFFQALRQDPVLQDTKLIAEPWDIGPGGYRLGGFPHPFAEWNDRFRDTARRVWRGDAGHLPEMAARLTGSADLFDHSGRPATASVNFITAHDGFTLTDLTRYAHRHNAENKENGRDGHGDNISDNLGEEGPTSDPARQEARDLRRRNLMATLLLSQGVPMLLAGDEIGNSQGGNNNAYAMDNPTGWIDWANRDDGFERFAAKLIALRQAHPILRQTRFLHGETTMNGARNLIWRRPDGQEMRGEDWSQTDTLLVELREAAGTAQGACLVALCPGEGALPLTLPPGAWTQRLDTWRPEAEAQQLQGQITLQRPCVALFTQEPAHA